MGELIFPQGLWALRLPDKDGKPVFVPPADDDGTDGLMCWPSRQQAKEGLEHQVAMGYFDDGPIPEIVEVFNQLPAAAKVLK